MWQEDSFLNSNLFVALITIIAGLIAFLIYAKQKRDHKRDAAKLILQEIRYAEQQIRVAKDHDFVYSLVNKLLPTNSWNKNIHLFIKDLKETQLDLISRFYSSAIYLDKLIEIISDKKTELIEETFLEPISIQNDFIVPNGTTLKPNNEGTLSKKIPIKKSLVAEKILKEVSMKIEFIYNTPVVDKLRKISERKWYQIF